MKKKIFIFLFLSLSCPRDRHTLLSLTIIVKSVGIFSSNWNRETCHDFAIWGFTNQIIISGKVWPGLGYIFNFIRSLLGTWIFAWVHLHLENVSGNNSLELFLDLDTFMVTTKEHGYFILLYFCLDISFVNPGYFYFLFRKI